MLLKMFTLQKFGFFKGSSYICTIETQRKERKKDPISGLHTWAVRFCEQPSVLLGPLSISP